MTQMLDPELFLPDPDPAAVKYTVISVDDHLVEPRDMFEGRLPARLQAHAPKIVVNDLGHEVWEFEGQSHYQAGMNAVVGRRPSSYGLEPFRFDQMRPGCYDPHARVKDMDLGGIWAAVNFPSMITGFCGRVYSSAKDRDLGYATARAYNDWMYEEWWQAVPRALHPVGHHLSRRRREGGGRDPAQRRARLRGGEPAGAAAPHRVPVDLRRVLGPGHARVRRDRHGHLHARRLVGSRRASHRARPSGATATLFGQLALTSCAEWVWSGWMVRYPELKIAMSEGGLGWVAMLLDRFEFLVDRAEYLSNGYSRDNRPADVLRRNFWFCTIDDPSTIDTRYAIGVENIMLEVDYPHGDSTWPDTQQVIEKSWGHVADEELRLMTHANAAKLFRHPLPEVTHP